MNIHSIIDSARRLVTDDATTREVGAAVQTTARGTKARYDDELHALVQTPDVQLTQSQIQRGATIEQLPRRIRPSILQGNAGPLGIFTRGAMFDVHPDPRSLNRLGLAYEQRDLRQSDIEVQAAMRELYGIVRKPTDAITSQEWRRATALANYSHNLATPVPEAIATSMREHYLSWSLPALRNDAQSAIGYLVWRSVGNSDDRLRGVSGLIRSNVGLISNQNDVYTNLQLARGVLDSLHPTTQIEETIRTSTLEHIDSALARLRREGGGYSFYPNQADLGSAIQGAETLVSLRDTKAALGDAAEQPASQTAAGTVDDAITW